MTLQIEEPDWAEILDAAMTRRLLRVHVAAPGVIVDYDETKQTATVQLVIQEEAGDAETFETIPPLTDVPVAWPAGGGYAITMPLAAGDPVEVVFQECDDSLWRANGDISKPKNLRRHGLYPRAIPCGGLDSKQLPAQSGKLVISSSNGSGPGVVLDGSIVELGGGADFVALAGKVMTALNKIQSIFDAHIHPAPGGATSVTGTLIGTLTDVGASKVKGT